VLPVKENPPALYRETNEYFECMEEGWGRNPPADVRRSGLEENFPPTEKKIFPYGEEKILIRRRKYSHAVGNFRLRLGEVLPGGRLNGETYRPHYAIDLHTMTSETFKITKEETGETLSNFDFRRGDLVVADRAYGTLKGMNHCLNRGADYILRLRTGCFAVHDENGNKFDITGVFTGLKSGESGEGAVFVVLPDKTRIPVRICAKRKDKEACEKSLKRLERRASRKGNNLQEKTVEFNIRLPLKKSLKHTAGAGRLRYISRG
jgi:hypothetical protein